jgi:putative membrane protein
MPHNSKHAAAKDHPERLEIDMRFLLANERTLLAWLRTSLALLAGGLALTQFSNGSQHLLSIYLLALGAITGIIGYLRYRSADQAIRSDQLPRPGFGPIVVVVSITAVALVVLLNYIS